MTLWSGGLTRSRDNLKPLYLHKDSTYGHQTWRYGDLTWGVPSHKVTRFFDDVVLRITWQTEIIVYPPPQCLWPPNSTGWWLAIRSFYLQSRIALESCGFISTTTMLMATKLGGMMTYLQGFLVIKSLDPLITWSCEITEQTKIIASPLRQCLRPPNLAGRGLSLRDSNL